MTFLQLKNIMSETTLSPEQLAKAFGISNMTLRRWSKNPPQETVPTNSVGSIIEGMYKLIINGHLSMDSKVVREVINSSPSLSFEAVVSSMGLDPKSLKDQETFSEKVTFALFQIGSSSERQKAVTSAQKKMLKYKAMGADWGRAVASLSSVITSRKLAHIEKLIAYGALFYLIAPIDLIPDAVPFAGMIDDFSFITLAVSYYSSKKII